MTDDPAACVPDPARLEPVRDLIAANEYPTVPDADDWGMGNVLTRAVAYSCGHLAPANRPPDHRHDPAEVDRCARLADEVAGRFATFYVREGARLRPFFAAAVVGVPVAAGVSEELVRRAFGGTLFPGVQFSVTPLAPHPPGPRKRGGMPGGRWPNPLGLCVNLDDLPDPNGDIGTQQLAAWDAAADWFAAVPGLTGHAAVGIGFSDADPGPLKPRLLLALTAAGSLVGVIGYETQA